MPKLMFVITEDWFFLSHFKSRAEAAVAAGFEVVVVTNFNKGTVRPDLRSITLENWPLKRGSLNPFSQLISILRLQRLILKHRPDILHSVGLLPILLAGFSGWISGKRGHVFAPVGLGYIFTASSHKARILQPIVALLLKLATAHEAAQTIFENQDDRAKWLELKLTGADASHVIPGAGVDFEVYKPAPVSDKAYDFIMVSRLLWEKGVGTFVEAAELAKARGKNWSCVLVGASDAHNHGAVPQATLENWHKTGAITWLGPRSDVPELLKRSKVYVLPSAYGEGLPKAILEAMASGLPVVTTDTPGCREAIKHEETGLLVPRRDSEALFLAMERLQTDEDLRQTLGKRGREAAIKLFSTSVVNSATLEIWKKL